MNKYQGLPVIFLKPGEIHIAQEPVTIKTILGSCVAACLYLPRQRISALCHGVLPRCPDWGGKDRYYYVDSAISILLEEMASEFRGETPRVALYGGAAFVPRTGGGGGFPVAVGTQNINAAREVLARYSIRAYDQQVGGNLGRRLVLDSATGRVQVDYLIRQRPVVPVLPL